MPTTTIGFLGFGEAAPAIAEGIAGEGNDVALLAYDIAYASDRARFEARAARSRTTLVDSPQALAAGADLLLSLVTCSEAVAAAGSMAPHLGARHLYADFNSAAPAVKREVDALVRGSGARFAEVAVMDVVPPHRHRVPLLLAGEPAPELGERLAALGMRPEVLGPEIGSASATKMLRSIVVKGLQALLIECLLSARHYRIERRILDSVSASFPGLDWNALADYLTGRSALHAARQSHEMEDVAATQIALGETPIMARATANRLRAFAELGLVERFAHGPPASYAEVLDAIAERGGEARETPVPGAGSGR